MDKRQFLKASGMLVTGTMLSRLASGGEPSAARTNWAGNYTYSTDRLDLPKTVNEVRELVKSRQPLKALGARHSFNGIADSTGDQISLKYFDQMAVDPKARTVAVGAGVTYGRLAPYLDAQGYALHNLASLPHVSVVGACATATHGSGNKNGNLSTAVSAMEMVTADGEVRVLSRERDGERFRGVVVALGGLGVVTKATLDVQPTFQMRQVVYENLSMAQLEKHLDDIFSSGYSVSLFTDWQNHRITQVWIKSRVEPGDLIPAGSGVLWRDARYPESPPAGRALGRKLYRTDGNPRSLVRTDAAFPHELHAQQRRGAAIGVLRSPGPRIRSHSGGRAASGPGDAASYDLGTAHH